MSVVGDLVIIAVLFVLAVAMTYERPRAWLLAGGRALAERYGRPEHSPVWEQEHAELWLMARRKQLSEDLQRIEQLLRHDERMSATRQLGNRLAREQLRASLARIPDLLPGRDRFVAYQPAEVPRFAYAGPSGARPGDVAAPSPVVHGGRGTTAWSTTSAPTVEVLDVSGWR